MNTTVFPPRARLAVRVGVPGHRPLGLAQANAPVLHAKVREGLACIRDTAHHLLEAPDTWMAYAVGPPILRVISPLAEGADRIVAQEAINLGFELQCPLPLHREEYENDFLTPESRSQYRALLEKATAVLELDGPRTPSKQNVTLAYLCEA